MAEDTWSNEPEQGRARVKRQSCAPAVLFLVVIWLAVELFAVRLLGTSNTPQFQQVSPNPSPAPAILDSDELR
jgi:hypothetical protein